MEQDREQGPGAQLETTDEAPWGYRKDGTPRSKPGAKSNSTATKKASSSSRKTSKSSRPRPSRAKPETLFLEKWQAARITELIAGGIEKRYPEVAPLNLPTKAQQERLAHVIHRLSDVPPFSLVQPLFRRAVALSGVAGAGTKKGSSLVGDLGQYLYGWYSQNPDQLQAIYAGEVLAGRIPPVPLLPDPRRIVAEQMNGGAPAGVQDVQDMMTFQQMSQNMDRAMQEAANGR